MLKFSKKKKKSFSHSFSTEPRMINISELYSIWANIVMDSVLHKPLAWIWKQIMLHPDCIYQNYEIWHHWDNNWEFIVNKHDVLRVYIGAVILLIRWQISQITSLLSVTWSFVSYLKCPHRICLILFFCEFLFFCKLFALQSLIFCFCIYMKPL